ncbi:hypothetical protein DMX01_12345 [Pseudomonas fulva]|nr:hypothetical protein DMX01_12345 [Pseudomonas fulva]PYC11515.1 hypothetical protein DMX00_16930 [Pseudomonas fulva]HCL53766.1 hypothetical protein [Pseudomonas sp.]
MRLSNNRPIIAIDRRHVCLYLSSATCGFFGETGQVPTVEVPGNGPANWWGRFVFAVCITCDIELSHVVVFLISTCL